MFEARDFLLGGILPAFVAALALAAVWRAAGRDAVAWSTGVIFGYAAGIAALRAHEVGLAEGARRLAWPFEAIEWTPLVALVAAAPAAVASLRRSGERKLALRVALLVAVATALVVPLRLLWGGKYLPSAEVRAAGFATEAWSTPQAVAAIGGFAAVVLAAWGVWTRQVREDLPLLRGLLTTAAIVAASLTAALTGSFSIGQAIGALAAAVGGCAAATWLVKLRCGPERAAGPVLMVLASLLLLAVFYSEMRLWQAALLAIAATLAAGRLPRTSKLSTIKSGVLRSVLVALPLAIVVGVAAKEFIDSQRRLEEERAADPYAAHESK